ncbi:reverse transcriptase domain protein, partial [Paraphaeosphaeria sporulosa]
VAKGDKLESRAITGWLVGYEGTSIFRIWVPGSDRVVRTRDVVFLRQQRYSPLEPQLLTEEERHVVTVLDIDSSDGEEDPVIEQIRRDMTLRQPTVEDAAEDEEEAVEQHDAEEQVREETAGGLPTPQETPAPITPDRSASTRTQTKGGKQVALGDTAPNRRENNAPRRRNPAIILVGCLGFVSYFTRPDVAKAHSMLARHLNNPGQKHMAAVRTVWQYLYDYRFWAIGATTAPSENSTYIVQLSNDEAEEMLFFGASDAAFADDPETARSSFAYVFKLYGMVIDWKAKIMRSVTKSTTEAELFALSTAGTELSWWMNTFEAIGFHSEA